MAIEEVKSTATGPESYESKTPRNAAVATGSSTSLSDDEPRQPKVPEDCTFDTTEDPDLYKPISTYEGIHRWDPDFEWTEQEEKKLIQKVSNIVNLLLIGRSLNFDRID